MPRRIEDIISNKHKSVRDIPLERHERRIHIEKVKDDKDEPISSHRTVLTEKVHVSTKSKKKSTGLRWFILVIGVLILFAGVGYIASEYFSRAAFSVTPKKILVNIDAIRWAQNSVDTKVGTSTILYDSILITKSASTTVSSTMGPVLNTKAQGEIILFNSYSTQSQRLLAGSIFINDSGKLYRLSGSTVIPGYKLSSSKSIIPGTIKAVIVADKAGAEYNINETNSISDFKIPAFKGTSKYGSIFGRLNSAFTGGFSGASRVISTSTLASTTALLQSQIISEAMSDGFPFASKVFSASSKAASSLRSK